MHAQQARRIGDDVLSSIGFLAVLYTYFWRFGSYGPMWSSFATASLCHSSNWLVSDHDPCLTPAAVVSQVRPPCLSLARVPTCVGPPLLLAAPMHALSSARIGFLRGFRLPTGRPKRRHALSSARIGFQGDFACPPFTVANRPLGFSVGLRTKGSPSF